MIDPKKKEFLSLIEEEKYISKTILMRIAKSLNIKLNVSQFDFLMTNLIFKNKSLHDIPIIIFKELLSDILNSNNEQAKTLKTNENELSKLDKDEKDLKNAKKDDNINFEKPKKQEQKKLPPLNSQLPPIENSKPSNQKNEIKKKIINNYGKIEAIMEEEKIAESVESYNDYLVRIKPKYEDSSFSIVIFINLYLRNFNLGRRNA